MPAAHFATAGRLQLENPCVSLVTAGYDGLLHVTRQFPRLLLGVQKFVTVRLAREEPSHDSFRLVCSPIGERDGDIYVAVARTFARDGK